MLVLTARSGITLTKPSQSDAFREPLWIPRAKTCKKLSNVLFRLGFLFAHPQITQRKSKWAMNLLSWGLLTAIKYEVKGNTVIRGSSLPTNTWLVPSEVQFEAVCCRTFWRREPQKLITEDSSSKPLIYICYSVIWNGLFLSELQGKDN